MQADATMVMMREGHEEAACTAVTGWLKVDVVVSRRHCMESWRKDRNA